MSESVFNGFGQFSRPDIGLASNGSSNLSEIFESDKRDALRNVGISAETLDTLYGLSSTITREDLRCASGLEKLLLPSLNQISEVFTNQIPDRLSDEGGFYNPSLSLGGDDGDFQVKSNRVILFNGSLQCESAVYYEKTLGTRIFGPAVNQMVTMSTSRASLFNIELDPDNIGFYKSAKYANSIRVRRRSHINRIFIPKSNFIDKPAVQEAPTHALTLNLDNGNTGSPQPLKLLATKNTPLRIFCRLVSGTIELTFTEPTTSEDRYFYGVQIQPATVNPGQPNSLNFIPLSVERPAKDENKFTVPLDISNSGYASTNDLYMYLYVNPEKIKGIEFKGIEIEEFPDQKDLGLIGFNNLEVFKISGGKMKILPLWFKTLGAKLRVLDLSESGDFWKRGPMGWFDIRNTTAFPTNIIGSVPITKKVPLYTVVSYLSARSTGVFVNESGNDWSNTIFKNYLKKQSLSDSDNYRKFTALRELHLGDKFYGLSPDLSEIFPNLTVLDWSSPRSDNYFPYIFNDLPKINNNNNPISYDISGSGAKGNIENIGTSDNVSSNNHISRYPMAYFDISGRVSQLHNITGYINDPAEGVWDSWLNSAETIDFKYTSGTPGVFINLQGDKPWKSLKNLGASYTTGGVKFAQFSQPIRAPLLKELDIYASLSTGSVPELGGIEDTASLEEINIGRCNNLSTIAQASTSYLLSSFFANKREEGQEHRLKRFYANSLSLIDRPRLRFRDFENLHNLETIEIRNSSIVGKFLKIPLKLNPSQNTKNIYVNISGSYFYDLSTLSINSNDRFFARDIRTISASNMNPVRGGAIPPDFEGTDTGVTYINIGNSLTSQYLPNWFNSTLIGACVKETDPPTVLSGFTLNTYGDGVDALRFSEEDKHYILSRGVNTDDLTARVMVNDQIKTLDGQILATVLSVSSLVITISNPISIDTSTELYFYRRTVDMSGWFRAGFSQLERFNARNCRLSGTFRISTGFGKIKNGTLDPALDLSNNLLSVYEDNTLGKIFSGSPRTITVNLSNNNFPVTEIRKIIREVAQLEVKGFKNCLVKLGGNKLTVDNKYSNYTQQDIFSVSTFKGDDIITSLFRNERFKVYEEVQTIDGVTYTEKETIIRNISGQDIDGTYYKTKINSTQVSVEDELATKFKNLKGIKIDLGFVYQSPNTSPVITGTSYTNETTRDGSINESGLEKITCPGSITYGTSCWRDSINQSQILNLLD